MEIENWVICPVYSVVAPLMLIQKQRETVTYYGGADLTIALGVGLQTEGCKFEFQCAIKGI